MRIQLNYHKVEELFQNGNNSGDIALEIIKMTIPDWEKVKKVEGWPTINRYTSKKIFNLFIEFDVKHHPDTFKGGVWLNYGFSTLEADKLNLKNWEVDTSTCKIVYQ